MDKMLNTWPTFPTWKYVFCIDKYENSLTEKILKQLLVVFEENVKFNGIIKINYIIKYHTEL